MRYLQIQNHEEGSIKEKSPDMVGKIRLVTEFVARVILVVVRFLGDRANDRRYRPGRVTLLVATSRCPSRATSGTLLDRDTNHSLID